MKGIVKLLVLFFVFTSCGNEESIKTTETESKKEIKKEDVAGKATIKGKIEGSANEKLVFSVNQANTQPKEVGSTNTNENGEFSIEIPIDGINIVFMNFLGQNLSLLVQSGDEVQINTERERLIEGISVDGPITMKLFNKYVQKILAKRQDMIALSGKYNELRASNPKQADQVKAELDQMMKEIHDWIRETVKENPDEPGMYVFLQDLGPNQGLINWDVQNLEYHKIVLKAMESKYPNNSLTTKLASDISSWESQLENVQKQKDRIKKYGDLNREVAIGKPAPDIFLDSPDGKEIKLSDLKGKVVLIDFWASWCGPCRKENPNVVNIYHKYKDKGFTVYSVSLDEKKDRWEQAIKTDGLIWENHVSDLQGWNSIAAQLYKVSSIPATFLIDKNGIIRAMNVRGATLEQKLLPLL
ncbi:MAG: TlpA disulfide reductase family protein [Crocinitomicaceae bacterium]